MEQDAYRVIKIDDTYARCANGGKKSYGGANEEIGTSIAQTPGVAVMQRRVAVDLPRAPVAHVTGKPWGRVRQTTGC